MAGSNKPLNCLLISQRLFLTPAVTGANFVALSKLSKPMTEAHAEQRHTPYASLRSPTDGDAAKPRGEAPTQNAAVEPDYLTAEADKLEGLKQALYAAFIAAPKSGIPTALIDLAATYTSALRLQLTLKGFSAVPTKSVKAPMFNTGRAK
jgi:hypothetical protein